RLYPVRACAECGAPLRFRPALMFCYVAVDQPRRDARVPLTPATAAVLARLGLTCHAPAACGRESFYADQDYQAAGVTLTEDREGALGAADLVLRVGPPPKSDIACM